MLNPAPQPFYIGDAWTFQVVPSDGSTGIGATMLVGGSGYTSPPQVVFSAPPPGGRAAVATAVIAAGSLTGIVFSDQGVYMPGRPPSIALVGGGGLGGSAMAVVGNPIDLTGCTAAGELFQVGQVGGIDISASMSVSDQAFVSASGVPFTRRSLVSTTVPPLLTSGSTAADPCAKIFPTRVHAYYTDGAGNRRTFCVIPIVPLAP